MKNEKEKKDKMISRVKDGFLATRHGKNIINIFKAALSSTPIGSIISSLLTDYIVEARFKRLENFAKQIAEDLKNFEDQIDENFIKTDEFAYIFEQSIRGVAQNYQKEKLKAFRAILVNSAILKDVAQDEKEYFLSLVNNLSTLHIQILKFLAFPSEYIKEQGLDPNSIHGGFSQIFLQLMPGLNLNVIESAFGDLYQSGFINTDKTIFHTTTSARGLRLVGDRCTILGKRFIEFCSIHED